MNRIEKARLLLSNNRDLNDLSKGELHICIGYFSMIEKRELNPKYKAIWLYALNTLYLIIDNKDT